ncbi:hypothetical protein [Rufibacter quisquiliarum]|uniref:Uncharacterized protein n=1 Tax=Rufibacter quisquiliarum TaxID=1549639 RepID=A0A839GUM0_9BACT|nr:hypothetical protein [Rufibacter quisquiliarum]MBA9078118.1 hypothetical protein [Rufibacter quisquiliarum]
MPLQHQTHSKGNSELRIPASAEATSKAAAAADCSFLPQQNKQQSQRPLIALHHSQKILKAENLFLACFLKNSLKTELLYAQQKLLTGNT